MRKFKMKEKYFRIYMVLGAMLLIVGVASIINDNVIGLIASGGSKIKIAYPIIITILGICVIMKALRCCVEIGDSKIIYCNGLLPKKDNSSLASSYKTVICKSQLKVKQSNK